MRVASFHQAQQQRGFLGLCEAAEPSLQRLSRRVRLVAEGTVLRRDGQEIVVEAQEAGQGLLRGRRCGEVGRRRLDGVVVERPRL